MAVSVFEHVFGALASPHLSPRISPDTALGNEPAVDPEHYDQIKGELLRNVSAVLKEVSAYSRSDGPLTSQSAAERSSQLGGKRANPTQ